MSRIRTIDAHGTFSARSACRGIRHRGRAAGAILAAILVVGVCLALWARPESDSPVVAEEPAVCSNPLRDCQVEPLGAETQDASSKPPCGERTIEESRVVRNSPGSQNPLRDGVAEESVSGGSGEGLNPLRDGAAVKPSPTESGLIAVESVEPARGATAEASGGEGTVSVPELLRDSRTEIRLQVEAEEIAQEAGRGELKAIGPAVAVAGTARLNPLRSPSPRLVRLDSVLRVDVTAETPSDAEAEVLAVFQPGTPSDAEAEVLAMFRAPNDDPAPAAAPSTMPRQQPAPTAEQRRSPEEVATPGPTYDFESRPIGTLTVITARRAGDVPADLGREKLTQMQAKKTGDPWVRNWPLICYQWEAPALCHRPLYFEEVNLERYGYGPKYLRVAQPVISAGQFFATVPALPYRMFAEPARECVYTLGDYRPGSLVPYDVIYPPPSLTGAGVESALITGLILAIP